MSTTPASNVKASEKSGARPLLQVGFVPMRCGGCNALVANVSPGAVISTVCRRCNAQLVFCAPLSHFVVDNNVLVSKD